MYQLRGERSSGTNYVQKLLRGSLTLDRSNALGWKHGFPHVVSIPDNLLVVCVFRNALDWMLSMHRKPWHTTRPMQKLGFSEFLRTPWQTEIGDAGYFNRNKMPRIARRPLQYDRHPLTGEVIPNVVSLRNLKTTAFLGMSNRPLRSCWCSLSMFWAIRKGFVKMLKRRFHLEGPDHYDVGERRLGEKFAASVRRRPQTPETVPDSDYTFILNQLDLQQEAHLGYSYSSGGA